MRPSQRPLSFEQEYPKHEFAPLVGLGLKAASWAAKRLRVERPRPEDASPRGSRVGSTSAVSASRRAALTTAAVIAALALAATFTRAYADCPSADAADSLRAVPVGQEKVSGLTRSSKMLREAIKASKSDDLDVYNGDFSFAAESLASLVNR